ncbi:hypothetical protein F5148DRAFT_1210975 [Russula earlei]|uniref:Uncharacterized protein n=1 Tax=Russula earlei TaxID=71964 RepID=A0ACC0U4V5_9AGAM|nr:hypothetical protein F5148DRAFT_1210975 [Russula earlei]
MQNPEVEIEGVVQLLTCAASPNIQQDAVRKYFASDASFRHPTLYVEPAPNSREGVLGIYQWYRITLSYIELSVDSITYDGKQSLLFLDTSQVVRVRFSPFSPARIRVLSRIAFREEGGLHYITSQEDFYHAEDIVAAMLPPLARFVSLMLRISGFWCGLSARVAQAVFGVWRPRREN